MASIENLQREVHIDEFLETMREFMASAVRDDVWSQKDVDDLEQVFAIVKMVHIAKMGVEDIIKAIGEQ